MKFCRIDLSKTNYNILTESYTVPVHERDSKYNDLQKMYQQYCRYKNFSSVMPIFYSEIIDPSIDVIEYYNNNNVVAWSLLKRYDTTSVESVQFSWNYLNPKLRLGIRSIEHECAYYKQLGFSYLYLGETADYKCKFNGYEELGPI
jgi:hypothetical protein